MASRLAQMYLLAPLLFGCVAHDEPEALGPALPEAPPVTPAGAPPDSPGSPARELLVELEVGDAHVVRFWELGPGELAIEEGAPLAAHPLEVLGDLGPQASLAGAYGRLAASVDPDVLAVLSAADARALDAQRASAARLAYLPGPGEPTTMSGGPDDLGGAAADRAEAVWFRDARCNDLMKKPPLPKLAEKPPSEVTTCALGVPWVYVGPSLTTWARVCAAAPAHGDGVDFFGGQWRYQPGAGEPWVLVEHWDTVVTPGRLACWTFAGAGYREAVAIGRGIAPRTHLSARSSAP